MSFVNDQKGKRFNMDKKIPRNPKYNNVSSTIDTGASMSKHMQQIEKIRRDYKFLKDEHFKRMKITTFVQLLIQVERINFDISETPLPDFNDDTPVPTDRPDTADREVSQIVKGTPTPSLILTEGDFGAYQEPETVRSTLLSVARGVGEMDINNSQPQTENLSTQQTITDDRPYLLLDARDKDEYDMYHIITAHSYPRTMMSRSINYETKEMLKYKNKEGKIIVVYDEDEIPARNVVTTLDQRGYENIFMLSGGLKVAFRIFPEGLTTGTPPPTLSKQKQSQFHIATQRTFTQEDIDALEMSLNLALQSKSSSSRLSQPLSRNSAASSRISSRSSNVSSVSHTKPFK